MLFKSKSTSSRPTYYIENCKDRAIKGSTQELIKYPKLEDCVAEYRLLTRRLPCSYQSSRCILNAIEDWKTLPLYKYMMQLWRTLKLIASCEVCWTTVPALKLFCINQLKKQLLGSLRYLKKNSRTLPYKSRSEANRSGWMCRQNLKLVYFASRWLQCLETYSNPLHSIRMLSRYIHDFNAVEKGSPFHGLKWCI